MSDNTLLKIGNEMQLVSSSSGDLLPTNGDSRTSSNIRRSTSKRRYQVEIKNGSNLIRDVILSISIITRNDTSKVLQRKIEGYKRP